MSFKAFTEANQSGEKSKKKIVEIPRTLGEIISYLCATIFKHPAIAEFLADTLSQVICKNSVHL